MNTGLVIGIALVLVIIIGGAAYYFLMGSGTSSGTSTTPVVATTPAVSNTPAVVNTPVATEPIFMGCYKDTREKRIFPKQFDNQQSVAACIALAKAGGYSYAGLQYGGECWAGNTLPTSSKLSDNACYTACNGGNGGDAGKYAGGGGCGGEWAASIYKL